MMNILYMFTSSSIPCTACASRLIPSYAATAQIGVCYERGSGASLGDLSRAVPDAFVGRQDVPEGELHMRDPRVFGDPTALSCQRQQPSRAHTLCDPIGDI